MKIVIFGLTVSSSWGNGHATLWRALCAALSRRGHHVIFFERDVPYYSANRDLSSLPSGELVLYSHFSDVAATARRHLSGSDLALVTSYCPDGARATDLVLDSTAAVRGFYDLDTPITLQKIRAGEAVDYLPPNGLRDFDIALSYTGGRSLEDLQLWLGARRVAALYGSVDPKVHAPVRPVNDYRSDFSYLGTYASDRQPSLEKLFLEPARRLPERRFVIGGAQYPPSFPWAPNIFFMRHMPPPLHPSFFSSARATLNITRKAMADCGYCPSGRLFEAAACGVPIFTDQWPGLDRFFAPGEEVIAVQNARDVIEGLECSDDELIKIAKAARERVLSEHTADHRVRELESLLETLPETSTEALAGTLPAGNPGAQTSTSSSAATARARRRPQPDVWGIIPAAGLGSRIQPLAFSKELLPVGSRIEGDTERPRAVSEYIIERMIAGGATKLCFVISPGKSDILEYYASGIPGVEIVYVVQPKPGGLCDALFRALPVISRESPVLIGLPDTIWFPEQALARLPDSCLSFLLFPVDHPELFDAVLIDEEGLVTGIDVKLRETRSRWVWGAFKMPGNVFHELHSLWRRPERGDEYIGTLVNAYLKAGGRALGVRGGRSYVDVGTLHGYREATRLLNERAAGFPPPPAHAQPALEAKISYRRSGELEDAGIVRTA